MKTKFIASLVAVFSFYLSHSQEWMRSLPIAQDLAMAQNKMVLMVWEDMTKYRYPVLIKDKYGRNRLVPNLFTNERLSPIIWENFVPVIVNENMYESLFLKIKNKRKQSYIDKFNDNSIKIMDINGNILNTNPNTGDYENISVLLNKYALNTTYLASELKNYHEQKNFYSAYFLAAKYMDFSLYFGDDVRAEILRLSEIYSDEASSFLIAEPLEDRLVLEQRLALLESKNDVIAGKPQRAYRKLKRIKKDGVLEANQPMFVFLSFTTHMITKRYDKARALKSSLSSVNLKKAQKIININK
ncbi:hypothetical protein [Winogradskyella aurantia]|uniref:Uncharacterized protein n=1 Tax=Winogradskyella aurantia TaxID=1915063 RepID=A0A265UUL6_9FLAO|nr:hypothetical protein [Winogradskyella aurantia]OZV69009.1 hypothetical protein CA834_05985 [Winogradskyella aurantia]